MLKDIVLLVALTSPTFAAKSRTIHHNNGAFSAGQNAGAAVNNLVGAKFSAIGGFFAGLVTGQSANNGGGHYNNGGCGSHGCGGGGNYNSGCGGHGCGGGGGSTCHNCGGGSNYHPAPAPNYNNYPNCQCDWLFNDHGQGNCNVGASWKTSDRWCYVKTKVHGKWVDPQWACPDSKASTVHHGRYWSNVACNTNIARGKRSAWKKN